MVSDICKARGKHQLEPEERRVYYPPNEAIPNWNGDECARLKAGFVKVDIDDYDKKTGEPINFIKGERRSDVIKRILDEQKVKYNLLLTERGKHFYFKLPENLIGAKKINWYSNIGIEMEYHPGEGTAKTHIPYKVNGIMRQWVVGSLYNEDIDEIPLWLYPLQKSKDRPFNLDITSGSRNSALSSYLFYLVENKQYTAENAFQIVRLMNDYVLPDPLPKDEIDTILRDETLHKLKEMEREKADKTISHSEVAQEIIEKFNIITVNSNFYNYEGGVYKPFDESKITEHMTTFRPKLNGNFEKEVVRHIRGLTRTDYPEDDGTVNIRNGILTFSDDGAVTLKPHSKDYISFRQFNAIYDPKVQCKLLDDCLFKWFSGDSEQIELFNQLLGYLMMNHVNYQKIFFFVGAPATGKNTLLNAIACFCRKENISAIQLDDMGAPFGLATIVNKTANIFADLKKSKVIASDKFKMLADGSPLKINQKHKAEFTYSFTGKLLFGMNQYPDFSSDFAGIERRLVIFTFKHIFKQDDKDYNPRLTDDLSTDECMSALLNKAISGYKTLLDNRGFISTKESGKALADFVYANDSVRRWLHEAGIDEDVLLHNPIKDGFKGLYPDYCAFCINIGETAKRQRDFSNDICIQYGFEPFQKEQRLKGERIRYQMFRRK